MLLRYAMLCQVSHVWESHIHPDPEARTLRAIAKAPIA